MTDTIPVVEEAHARDEAEAMGYRRFEDVDRVPEHGDPVAPFRDSESYANHVLPALRCLAGFGDSGLGTWNVAQDVILIPDGNEEDHPADGVEMSSSEVYEDLVDAWHDGAYRAIEQVVGAQEVDR